MSLIHSQEKVPEWSDLFMWYFNDPKESGII